jgi:hypothetical protein
MYIRTNGVFLSGEMGMVWEEGKQVSRFVGKFHQPKSKDNGLFLGVFSESDGQALDQYRTYQMDGHLNSWAGKNGNVSHKLIVDRLEQVTAE